MNAVRLIQHWLIPITLISVNAAIIHLIYQLYINGIQAQTAYLFLSISWLIGGIIFKNKYILISGNVVYWTLLIFILTAV